MAFSARGHWWLDAMNAGEPEPGRTIVVAVIDSGLDFAHPDIDPGRIWRHGTEVANGRDDDGNGYIDDLIGWDFVDEDNNPWDSLGHGTFVTGLIAATRDNAIGIDGLTDNVQIMPLRVLNSGGYGNPRALARAVIYAIDNGASVINLSLGQAGLNGVDRWLTRYAAERGVLVVIAAGNAGTNVASFGPAGAGDALIVGASDERGKHAAYSNVGARLSLVAPGSDIVSLRARRTDFNLIMAVPGYAPGSGIQGESGQLYRADGTSFAAPLVAAAAAQLWSQRPSLDRGEIIRVLEQSARDVDDAGFDWRTGFGSIDLAAALEADPGSYTLARIDRVAATAIDGQPALAVFGVADSSAFRGASIEIRRGQSDRWRSVATVKRMPVASDDAPAQLAALPAALFSGSTQWQLRLLVESRGLPERSAMFELQLN
ncbi:MAG: S8 family serine peptidase [Pseudomonadaceae bacterium]|nr:S8 family serine peptidase [Pseudomonadaceae bacterium]